jgi:three-Cys-motif partner protein
MARTRRPKSALHQDEVSTLEAHRQTVHKLALVRDYGGACCGILAQFARKKLQRVLDITLVDVYAGAGQHRSVADPDGVSKGTALIFSTIGREIQRTHSLARVHVRLNDIDSDVVKRLDARVEHYRQGQAPSERVDVAVTCADAKDEIVRVAREAGRRNGFSLLFVDPFGMPPDFAVIDEAGRVAGWHEMLINLDVSDMFRLRLVAQLDVAEHAKLSAGDERVLGGIFGDSSWRRPYGAATHWTAEALAKLATTYADRFADRYPIRAVYRLWSSDNQIRFMVHLANKEMARTTFASCYARTQRSGLFQGTRLNDADRATYAQALFESLAGAPTTIEEVYSAALVPLDRGRIRDVFREAQDRGYGRLDGNSMEWFRERVMPAVFKPAMQLDLELGA